MNRNGNSILSENILGVPYNSAKTAISDILNVSDKSEISDNSLVHRYTLKCGLYMTAPYSQREFGSLFSQCGLYNFRLFAHFKYKTGSKDY